MILRNTKLQNLKRDLRLILLKPVPDKARHKYISSYKNHYTKRVNKINYLLKQIYEAENKIGEVDPELRLEIIKLNPYNNDADFHTAKSPDTNLIVTLVEPNNLIDLGKRLVSDVKRREEKLLFFLRGDEVIAIFVVPTELEARIMLLYLIHFGEIEWFRQFDAKPDPNENGTSLEIDDLQETIEKVKKKPRQVKETIDNFNKTSVYHRLRVNGNTLEVYERGFLKERIEMFFLSERVAKKL